jgi:hypothetical protein
MDIKHAPNYSHDYPTFTKIITKILKYDIISPDSYPLLVKAVKEIEQKDNVKFTAFKGDSFAFNGNIFIIFILCVLIVVSSTKISMFICACAAQRYLNAWHINLKYWNSSKYTYPKWTSFKLKRLIFLLYAAFAFCFFLTAYGCRAVKKKFFMRTTAF